MVRCSLNLVGRQRDTVVGPVRSSQLACGEITDTDRADLTA